MVVKMQIGLVGATNVGKSTLFNRLIGQFRAIVTDIPGTTRDILYHTALIDDIGEVIFADSPGLEFQDERAFIQEIVDTSDLVLFMVDDKEGITAKEEHIIKYIRDKNKQKQTILIINKIDLQWKESETSLALTDYHKLGFKHIVGISAKNYRNLDLLQEEILLLLNSGKIKVKKEPDTKDQKQSGIGLAILGKPNVGKSTLLNTLTKKQLAKVENIPGTTRDYIVGDFIYNKKHYAVYDTAGLRKKGKMKVIEKIAYKKTIDMLKFIRPITLFLIDSIEDISHRDMTLLHEINQIGLCIIVGLNKTDLLTPPQITTLTKKVQAYLDFAKYIPIIPMIATTGHGIKDVMKMVKLADTEMKKRINTNELNKIISKEFISRPPRFPKNKICKLLYITQTEIDAPTFIVFVNNKDRVNFAFKKRIDNSIREHFGYIATPLVIRFRSEKGKGKDNKAYRTLQEKKKEKKK